MRRWIVAVAVFVVLAGLGQVQGALLTFDDAITGATTYSFDGDGDGTDDVIFSTTDPAGFNTTGPGPNMSYIDEPGLEGTVLLSPDLKVEFLTGVGPSIDFGFAMSTQNEGWGVTFDVYDDADLLITSTHVTSAFTDPPGPSPKSSFPEARVHVDLVRIGAYATFDFDVDPHGGMRYIIDNFEGKFGSTEDPGVIPEPSTVIVWSLLGACALCFGRYRRRKAA